MMFTREAKREIHQIAKAWCDMRHGECPALLWTDFIGIIKQDKRHQMIEQHFSWSIAIVISVVLKKTFSFFVEDNSPHILIHWQYVISVKLHLSSSWDFSCGISHPQRMTCNSDQTLLATGLSVDSVSEWYLGIFYFYFFHERHRLHRDEERWGHKNMPLSILDVTTNKRKEAIIQRRNPPASCTPCDT